MLEGAKKVNSKFICDGLDEGGREAFALRSQFVRSMIHISYKFGLHRGALRRFLKPKAGPRNRRGEGEAGKDLNCKLNAHGKTAIYPISLAWLSIVC